MDILVVYILFIVIVAAFLGLYIHFTNENKTLSENHEALRSEFETFKKEVPVRRITPK